MLYDAIPAVQAAGHRIDRIVTAEPADFYQVSIRDFESRAAEVDADFLVPTDINDDEIVETFATSPSAVAISVNWPTLLQKPVLDAFEHGVLNGHAGDLPRYRGNAAPNWAIIAGEDEVVLTVHRMTTDLDRGPILAQRRVQLTEETYIGDVYERMWRDFPELFAETVTALDAGRAEPRPQSSDPSESLRCYPRIPKDSELDWSRSAPRLARVVRASAEPLFGAYTHVGGRKLRVWRARAESPQQAVLGTPGQVAEIRSETGTVAVVAGDGLLVLEEVQWEDGDRTPPHRVITSSRTRLGMDETARIRELERRVADLEDRLGEGE